MQPKPPPSRNRPQGREGKTSRPGDSESQSAAGRAAQPLSKSPSLAARPKVPVPVGAVWWVRGEGHPCLQFFGAELRSQRAVVRGWSLEDLHQASGLSKSFLSELECGQKTSPSEEVIMELEAAMGMVDGGLMALVRRRWMRAVAMEVAQQGVVEPLARQMRAIRRVLRRHAVGLWLAGWWPSFASLSGWELALEV